MSSPGGMQTYCVVVPWRTECAIPFATSRSSVEYTFEEGRPAERATSLPFCAPWRSRPTYTRASYSEKPSACRRLTTASSIDVTLPTDPDRQLRGEVEEVQAVG